VRRVSGTGTWVKFGGQTAALTLWLSRVSRKCQFRPRNCPRNAWICLKSRMAVEFRSLHSRSISGQFDANEEATCQSDL
jgi:hypothetical protein